MSDNEVEDADVSFLPGTNPHRRTVYEPSLIQRCKLLLCTKARLATLFAAVTIFILLILVIASYSRRESPVMSSCDVSATPSNQSEPTTPVNDYISTNGKPFPYKNIRLPNFIYPSHYKLFIHPNIEDSTFVGSVAIDCQVIEITNFIVLHIKGLTVTKLQVSNTDNRAPYKVEEYLIYSGHEQVYIKLGQNLPANAKVTVTIEYSAVLSEQLNGFYKSMYKTNNGEKRYIATTHFEPTSARKAFPCFDEPAMKATFQLTMVRDPNRLSLFNMPLEKTLDYKDGLKRDVFQTSVKMSTYLVAFVVCDYKHVTASTSRNITVRVFTPPDFIASADFALQTAVKVIDYYEQFFGVNYPLPKQDLIAIPDFEAGAMENWGLITYRMTAILYDPNKSSMANKQRVAIVVAHELAHQWFGNLVTLKWWNDLWLNEGFASYVEYIGTDVVKPDWKMMDQFVPDAVLYSMYLDSLENSHPINQPVDDPAQINGLFDSISYDKGASIIRMLNNYLGADVFKQGLTAYLKKYQFSNAATVDLWNSLSEAVTDESKKDVSSLMNTWTEQSGYPVVTISRSGSKVTVTQSRFLLNTAHNPATDKPSKYGYKWQIPFCYTTSGDPKTEKMSLLTQTSTQLMVDNYPATGWLKANCGVKGYYRVNYADDNWGAIAHHLNTVNQTEFSMVDRAGLIDDAFMMARTGQLHYKMVLDLTIYMVNERDYIPWSVFISNIKFLWNRLESKPQFGKLKSHLLKLLFKQLSTVTWEDTGSDLDRFQRGLILSQAIELDHDASVSSGRQLFLQWKGNQSMNLNQNLKGTIYKAGIAHGDDSDWEFLFNRYVQENDDSEKRRLVMALGYTKQASLLTRLLGSSIDPNVVRSQDTTTVVGAVTATYTGQVLAWRFVQKNWDVFYSRYGEASFTLDGLIKHVCGNFDTQFDYDEVKSFFDSHKAGSGSRAVKQVLEKIEANMEWAKNYEKEVTDWLQSRHD